MAGTLNIVAVSAEPEYVKLELDPSGASMLTIDIGTFNVRGAVNGTFVGSLQVNLMKSDTDNLQAVLERRKTR